MDNLYHGSQENFDEFEIPKYHTNGGTLGFGTYLTDSIERANSYADTNGYLYTVELTDELSQSQPLNATKVTLTLNQVAEIIEKIAEKQIEDEEYPYILSDWEEPTSETTIDAGNKAIINRIAQSIIDDTDDLNIINGINNQLGGNDSGADTLVPILNDVGIHYAVLDVEYYDNSKEYVVFNPQDIKIKSKEQFQTIHTENPTKTLKETAQEQLIVKADDPVQAVQKLYNNDLESAIQDSFTLSDVSEKEAQHFLKTVKWEDIVDMENSHDALKYHGNGLYSDEYIKPSSYNPYQENTKILNNDKQQGLSQQYKNLNKQINSNPDNNQHLKTQLTEVREKISQQTQQELKDYQKQNVDLKKPTQDSRQSLSR